MLPISAYGLGIVLGFQVQIKINKKALKPFARRASVELLGIWSRRPGGSLEEFVYRVPLTTWVATGVIQLLSDVGGSRLVQQSTGGRLARSTERAAIAARICPLETPSEPACTQTSTIGRRVDLGVVYVDGLARRCRGRTEGRRSVGVSVRRRLSPRW